MNIDLVSYLPELSFLTQEGRWQLLQEWIEDNPEYSKRLDDWLDETPDNIFPELREIAAQLAEREYGPLAGAITRTAQLTPGLSRWISTLQTCYKERKAEDIAEAKNARRKKTKV